MTRGIIGISQGLSKVEVRLQGQVWGWGCMDIGILVVGGELAVGFVQRSDTLLLESWFPSCDFCQQDGNGCTGLRGYGQRWT